MIFTKESMKLYPLSFLSRKSEYYKSNSENIMTKFLTNGIPLKVCPNCNHRYGLDFTKRFDKAVHSWYFRVLCKSCDLSTKEFLILEESRLERNLLKIEK